MFVKYLVIVVIGFSGVGIIIISFVFCKIFVQLNLYAVEVEGDSFYCYICLEMDMVICKVCDVGRYISYFGFEVNDFGLLE